MTPGLSYARILQMKGQRPCSHERLLTVSEDEKTAEGINFHSRCVLTGKYTGSLENGNPEVDPRPKGD